MDVSGREEMRRGFLWLGGASAIARVIDGVSVVILMWFTSREQLGLATLAWSISVFLEAANGLGIGTALLQARELSAARLGSAFWFTMGTASALVLLVSAASPWLAEWFGSPGLAPMIAVSSLKLWFVSSALIPLTLLNRATQFPRIAAVQSGATLGSALLTITLVVLGFGAWGLVLGQTSHGLLTAILAHVAQPYRPGGRFQMSESREDIAFGLKVTTSSLLYHFYRNADYYLIGKILGVGAVGVYRVAFDLAMTPTMAILGVINRSALPVYARLSATPGALREAFLWTLHSLGILLAPVTCVLVVLAEDLLRWVDQGRWIEAAPMVRWLAGAALLRCIAQTFPQVFHALRKPALAVYDSLFTMVALLLLMGAALLRFGESRGALVAAQSWVAVYPLAILFMLWLMRDLFPVSLLSLTYALRHTFGSMLALAMCAALLAPITAEWHASLRVLATAGAMSGSYLMYLRFVAGIRMREAFRTSAARPQEGGQP